MNINNLTLNTQVAVAKWSCSENKRFKKTGIEDTQFKKLK
jgi:hypothetical protein